MGPWCEVTKKDCSYIMVAVIKELDPHYHKTTDVHENMRTEKAQSN